MLPNLPYITSKVKGIGGKIKEKPEYFLVEEIPLYDPCGDGEHLFVSITKKNKTTREIQQELAKLLGLKPRHIGCAGMKDKYAVTTQVFSIKTGKLSEEKIKAVCKAIEENLGVKVRWAKLHKNKLRTGHLLGNKFSILITEIKIEKNEAKERVKKILDIIKRTGLPNFYGPQRFGVRGENIKKGLEIIKGKRRIKNKWVRRLLLSAYQSYLCNLYLAERLRHSLFDKIMKGDIAKKYETGGMFVVENVEREQKRYEAKEISFTAPIYGKKMWWPKYDALKFEKEVLEKSDVTIEELEMVNASGTRRTGRIFPQGLRARFTDKGLKLSFFLPKGSFATVLLREIMKIPDEKLAKNFITQISSEK